MLRISEILIKGLQKNLEIHKRNASGTASASLRENVIRKFGVITNIQILGIDYFDDIFNGTTGKSLTLSDLNQWAATKQKKYGVGFGGPSVLKRILEGKAWVNSQPEKLNLDTKTLMEHKNEVDTEVKKLMTKQIKKLM